MIGCDCEVCASVDPRDNRTRAAALVSWNGRNILIDTSTDLRQQLLANRIAQVDAILFTHTHADHIHGIDDVRIFSTRSGAALPAYGDARTCRFLRDTFRYIFSEEPETVNVPRIDLDPIEGPFDLFGKRIVPVPVEHGRQTILGFRIDRLAYLPDCGGIPSDSRDLLKNLDVLVLDALRPKEHPTHFSLSEALEAIEQIMPRRAYLTGLCHHLGHHDTEQGLPRNVRVAYDGLKLELPPAGTKNPTA